MDDDDTPYGANGPDDAPDVVKCHGTVLLTPEQTQAGPSFTDDDPFENRCDRCHQVLDIGDWPYCPHGRTVPSKGFEPHFDIGLGRDVTGWGDVRKAMREDHLDFRDHPSPAKQRAWRERCLDLRDADRTRHG